MTSAHTNKDDAPTMAQHDSAIHERPTLPEVTAYDAVVEPKPSVFARISVWIGSMVETIATALQRPTLSDYLPPVPRSSDVAATNERAETMLLEIMRSPPDYVDAAILIAQATRALRKRGDDVFAEGFVAFALSRIPADDDGTISMKRLRERVHEMPVAQPLMPVLLRLEEQGVVAMEMPQGDVSPSGMMRMDRARVRLLELP